MYLDTLNYKDVNGRLYPVSEMGFCENILEVAFDGGRADLQDYGYFFVRLGLRDETQDSFLSHSKLLCHSVLVLRSGFCTGHGGNPSRCWHCR